MSYVMDSPKSALSQNGIKSVFEEQPTDEKKATSEDVTLYV